MVIRWRGRLTKFQASKAPGRLVGGSGRKVPARGNWRMMRLSLRRRVVTTLLICLVLEWKKRRRESDVGIPSVSAGKSSRR